MVRGYAAVVLATPLERSGGLRLRGVGHRPRLRSYQRTVTTFVRGRLDPAWFGVARLPGELRVLLISEILHLPGRLDPAWFGVARLPGELRV